MIRQSEKRLLPTLLLLSILITLVLLFGACSDPPPPPSAPAPPNPKPQPTSPPVPEALPDFGIVGHWREPPEPSVPPNTPVRFHILVKNLGKAGYGGPIVVRGPGGRTGGFNALAVHETKEAIVELIVNFPDYGGTASNLYFTVDPDNVIKESNEGNNTLGPLTVVYGGG